MCGGENWLPIVSVSSDTDDAHEDHSSDLLHYSQ